jgi:hypothetical protein
MLDNAGLLRAKTSQASEPRVWTCGCGREYKHNQSYYRHRKACALATCGKAARGGRVESTGGQTALQAKVIELLEDSLELQRSRAVDLEARNASLQEDKADLRARQAELAALVREARGPVTNNFNNCVILLNTLCPSAISINEFSAGLRLTPEDLAHAIDNGYIAGVSNAFIKRLQGIEPALRPIQCGDSKGKDIYVKDEGTWSRDGGAVLGDHISTVSKQQLEALKVWEKEHPAWRESERETKKYIELVGELMGGSSNEERSRNHQLIRERIGQTCSMSDIVPTD